MMEGVPPGASIWMLNEVGREAAPRLSVTIAEKEKVFAAVGTPVSAPVAEFSESHAGRFADDQVSAPVPPVARSVWE